MDEDDVDVFNCVRTNQKALKGLSLKLRYNPPIYCDPKFESYNISKKCKLIYNYHQCLAKKLKAFQRNSVNQAQWGKAIKASSLFDTSLIKQDYEVKDISENKQFSQSDCEAEIYVCHSGRQTKRTLYTEDSDNEGEKEWKKKNKVLLKKNTVRKRPLKEENEENIKSSFLQSPSRSRSEKMFDKLTDQTREKEHKRKMNDKFMESLIKDNSDTDDFEELFSVAKRIKPNISLQQTEKEKKRDTNNSNSKAKDKCPICLEEFFQFELPSHTPQCLDNSTSEDILKD